jgi:hypothetical protein
MLVKKVCFHTFLRVLQCEVSSGKYDVKQPVWHVIGNTGLRYMLLGDFFLILNL